MTTPDIAGLCERLRYRLDTESDNPYVVSARTAEVVLTRIVPQDDLVEIANTLERQAAEIERLRKAAKAFEFAVTTDIPAGPGYAEWVAKAQQARATLRAALTGEGTAGSPTSQNTEPGLAFSDAGEP
jgi:hypothetical protein